MIVQSYYISEDEGYGVSESEYNLDVNSFQTEQFYEDLTDQYSEDLEEELIF